MDVFPHEDLFVRAMELEPQERSKFLSEACGEDAALRLEVEAMLKDAASAETLFGDQDYPRDARSRSGDAVEPGRRIGRYVIWEKIGEGGFGSVYRAEQQEPVRREVALKLVKLGMDTEQVIARFEAERQALALMRHPHIATVLDAGCTETGRPYFVMELVEGIPITQYSTELRLPLPDRLRLLAKVCHAVQHAHQKGIIHRDLKPTNILVGEQDGAPVPKVIDFGIAKATMEKLTESTLHTRAHQFMGTPAYMSPEQAEGGGTLLDTRSDVYALGALLYELITERPPFEPKFLSTLSDDEVRRIIREQDPVRPSSLLASLDPETRRITAERFKTDPRSVTRAIRGELDWIVLKAMEKDRTRRYATALALAEDIEHHLNDEPVLAAKPGAAYQLGKTMRRHRKAFVSLGLVLVSLVFGLTLAIWQAMRANASQHETEAALGKVEDIQRRLEHENYRSNIQLAQALIRSGEAGRAVSLLWGLPRNQRSWEWGYLMAQTPMLETWGWNTRQGKVDCMVLSRDGKSRLTVGGDRRVICWDWGKGTKRWERGFDHDIHQLVTDPANRYVAVTLRVQFPKTGALVILDQGNGTPVRDTLSIAMSDGAWWGSEALLVSTNEGITRLDSGSLAIQPLEEAPLIPPSLIRGTFPLGEDEPESILVSRGQRLAVLEAKTLKSLGEYSVAMDADLRICHADAAKDWAVAATLHTVYRLLPNGESSILYRHPSQIQRLIALDRDRLAVASDYDIAIIQSDGRVVAGWKTPEVTTALETLPDGRLLVADRTGFVRLYAPNQPNQSPSLLEVEHEAECRSVFFAPSGRQLGFMPWHKKEAFLITATPQWDGAIKTLATPDTHPGTHNSSDVPGFYPPTGELVCHTENQLEFHAIGPGGEVERTRSLPVPSAGNFFRFDLSGSRILFTSDATGPLDKGPSLYSVDSESGEARPLAFAFGLGTAAPSTNARAFALSPDGKLAAVSRHQLPGQSEWVVFHADTGEVLMRKETREGAPQVALHPDGKRVAVGYFSGTVEVWDIHHQKRLQRFQKDAREISALRFMGTNGERLVTTSADLRLRVWDWAFGEELLALETTTGATSIALSADGMAIAHGGYQPALTVRFALPWWFEQGDPEFYEALGELSSGQ